MEARRVSRRTASQHPWRVRARRANLLAATPAWWCTYPPPLRSDSRIMYDCCIVTPGMLSHRSGMPYSGRVLAGCVYVFWHPFLTSRFSHVKSNKPLTSPPSGRPIDTGRETGEAQTENGRIMHQATHTQPSQPTRLHDDIVAALGLG